MYRFARNSVPQICCPLNLLVPKQSYAYVKKNYTKETVSEKCFVWFFCDNLLFFLHLENDQKGGKG